MTQRWWYAVICFGLYTIASVAGLMLIKASLGPAYSLWGAGRYFNWSTLLASIGALLYIASFVVWLSILVHYELSFAYPTAIGLTLAFSTLGAGLLLGETLSLVRITGIVAIFAGILLITR